MPALRPGGDARARDSLRRRLEASPWGGQLAFTQAQADGLLLIRGRESGRLPAARALLALTGLSRLVAVGGTQEDLPLAEEAREFPWRFWLEEEG